MYFSISVRFLGPVVVVWCSDFLDNLQWNSIVLALDVCSDFLKSWRFHAWISLIFRHFGWFRDVLFSLNFLRKCLIFKHFMPFSSDFQTFYAYFHWFSLDFSDFHVIFTDFHLKIASLPPWYPWRSASIFLNFNWSSSRIVRSFLLFSSWCSTVHWTSFHFLFAHFVCSRPDRSFVQW